MILVFNGSWVKQHKFFFFYIFSWFFEIYFPFLPSNYFPFNQFGFFYLQCKSFSIPSTQISFFSSSFILIISFSPNSWKKEFSFSYWCLFLFPPLFLSTNFSSIFPFFFLFFFFGTKFGARQRLRENLYPFLKS